MPQTVLLVTTMSGAENCAAAVGRQLGLSVEVAENRRTALAALRRREYAVMVLDESLVEADPAGAEVLWQQAGLAVPIQVNLGISGCNRVLREVRAALQRRERELSLAMRAAAQIMEGEHEHHTDRTAAEDAVGVAGADACPGNGDHVAAGG